LYSISLCGLIRRSYTLTTNSNASGSSDIHVGGIYTKVKVNSYKIDHFDYSCYKFMKFEFFYEK
jgi:hypothetical protein